MIRFHSDDSMGFKGFALSVVAVDPLDDFDSENFEEESAEIATPFPGKVAFNNIRIYLILHISGYIPGGSGKLSRKKVDEDDENPDEGEEDTDSDSKKPEENEDLDEDLVTDNEDNYIYNSNRIGKENAVVLGNIKNKKKDDVEADD